MEEEHFTLTANNIQYYRTITVGWLLNAHVDSMDFKLFTKALQYNPRFTNIPIECKPIQYKSDPTYVFRKGGGKYVLAGIATAKEKKIIEAAISSCKDVFNRKTIESAKRRPQGANLFFFTIMGSRAVLLSATAL